MTSLQWRFINHAEVGEGWEYDQTQISFAFEMTPRMSLNCKLVPVQNREYEYGHCIFIKKDILFRVYYEFFYIYIRT